MMHGQPPMHFCKSQMNSSFTKLERQVIYYTAAHCLASKQENNAEVVALLKKALELKPDSELAPEIKSAMQNISQRLAE